MNTQNQPVPFWQVKIWWINDGKKNWDLTKYLDTFEEVCEFVKNYDPYYYQIRIKNLFK